jgi:hypothetical protein
LERQVQEALARILRQENSIAFAVAEDREELETKLRLCSKLNKDVRKVAVERYEEGWNKEVSRLQL